MALWLESPPREREVVGMIPGSDRPKTFKLVVVAVCLSAQDCGNSTATWPSVLG